VLQRGDFREKLELKHPPIVEHDLTDGELFPDLNKHCYMHKVPLSTGGGTRMEVLDEFQPLQVSSLMNLFEVPNFGSLSPKLIWSYTFSITRLIALSSHTYPLRKAKMQFFMSRVHRGKLWLDQSYPFTLEHVSDMASL